MAGRGVLVAVAWAAVVVAGCAGTPPSPGHADPDVLAALQGLRFPALMVTPTPEEVNEAPGPSFVAWDGGAFGLLSGDKSSGLYRMNILADGAVYTSNNGMGWVRHDYPQDVGAKGVTNRLPLLDLPALLADPGVQVTVRASGSTLNFTARGTITRGPATMSLALEMEAVDGAVTWAHLASQDTRESPFTFRPGDPLPFLLRAPPATLSDTAAAAGDARANAAHVQLIKLVQNYTASHAGTVPDELTPESLRLELVLSGQAWPANAFDGTPVRNAVASGDFGWTKCGERDGSYVGYGWDDALITKGFGRSCRAAGAA